MILETIIKAKNARLAQRMAKTPIGKLAEAARAMRPPSFRKALESARDVKLVCEYKRASPSGPISQRPLAETVRAYERGGAAAISVITEQDHFNGTLEDLAAAAKAVRTPILRKDFVTTEYEILEAKANGASAVLLITGVCPDLPRFIRACDGHGLDALVETKNEGEIGEALDAGARIVGINNRNLADLSIDLTKAGRLASLVPKGVLLVAESGFKNPGDVRKLASLERVPDAVLAGTAVMQELAEAGIGIKG
jgi:indole-3-glycerol phosphate synthase